MVSLVCPSMDPNPINKSQFFVKSYFLKRWLPLFSYSPAHERTHKGYYYDISFMLPCSWSN